jgi:uncharacterized protein YjaZ
VRSILERVDQLLQFRILEGPGYGTTVGEAIVIEGLADAFSLLAFPSTPPLPWANALQPEELDKFSTLARSHATTTDTPDLHSQWFFGSGDMPRWAGYTVGATWVRDFLATHEDVDLVAATLLPADDVIPG